MRTDRGDTRVAQNCLEFRRLIFCESGEAGIGITHGRAQLNTLKSRLSQPFKGPGKIPRDQISHRPGLAPDGQTERVRAQHLAGQENASRGRSTRFPNEVSPGDERHGVLRVKNLYSSQPARRSGLTSFCAASELVTFRFAPSQSRGCPVQAAMFPSSSVSVTLLSNSKFPPGLVFPPLQASSHSRSLPGERGKVLGGCWKLAILASGISLGFAPLKPQRIFPPSPIKSRPSSPSSPSPRNGRLSSSSAGRGGFSPPSYQVNLTAGIAARAGKS